MIELADDEIAADVGPFEQRVERAAHLVSDGIVSVEECEAHAANGKTDEEFLEAVRERVEDKEGSSDTPEEKSAAGPQISSADGVDWPALWEEFGFDTRDAHGNRYKSPTKVEEALRVTEQNVVGDVKGIIQEAVGDEILVEQTVELEDEAVMDEAVAGYILVGVNDEF